MAKDDISSCSKNKSVKLLSRVWFTQVLLFIIFVISKTTAFSKEHRDVALMAHVIGSGAMNIDHYFHSLGVACENRNSGFWKIIEQDRQKCMEIRDSSNSRTYYASLPQGSFEKMCRNWKNNEICSINFARDLNDCFGRSSRGSDALEFMEAYVTFSCRDIRDTESQLSTHTRRHAPINAPGVFKCFPEVQDRILTCVKEDTFSNSLCSQFSTVEHCFTRFYNDYRNCNNLEVVEYLRDLFRSMALTMKCSRSGQNGWNNVLEHSHPNPIEPILPHHPLAENKYPMVQKTPGSNSASKPYNPQHASWVESPPTVASNAFKPPYSQEKGSNSILLLPKPLPPVGHKEQTHWPQTQPFLLVPKRPIAPPPTSDDSYNHPVSPNKEEESPLGAWFNLQQQKFSQKSGPAWAWGYERYAPTPEDHPGDRDRFYSYRAEPRARDDDDLEIDHDRPGGGVYDLYRVHYDRYGMPPRPISRGLSNRPPQNLRKPKVILMEEDERHSTLWDLHDNHFRKFKDDHMFQGEPPPSSTPRIILHPRFTHSAPTSFPNRKRKVKGYVKDDKEEAGGGVVQDGIKITIISNTTVAPRILIKKSDNRNIGRPPSFKDVIPELIESYEPHPQQSTTITSLNQIPVKNDGQFFSVIHIPDQFNEIASSTIASKPKLFSVRPRFLENNVDLIQSGYSQSSITTRPKYRSRNITYSFPRSKNIKTLPENPDQTTSPPLYFDSKRVPVSPSGISTPQVSEDLEENTSPNFSKPQFYLDDQIPPTASPSRPKILRKIKVRKRPTTSTSTIIPEDY